jgi:hypothetical protein
MDQPIQRDEAEHQPSLKLHGMARGPRGQCGRTPCPATSPACAGNHPTAGAKSKEN